MQTLTDEDFVAFVGRQESQYIIRASEVTGEVMARLNGDVAISGDLLPWQKTQNCIALRPGEVSLWFAYNGHGKSQILGMICAWGLKTKKWLIASMEMKPAATMERMVRQVSGTCNPSDQFVDSFMAWTDGRLWIYDQNDSVEPERILGMVHYAAQELAINHIVIDSLMKCGIKTDDYNKQKDFVDRLCWAAKSHNIHIHLVHHARKGQDEYHMPDKHDARGAGELTDLVDNVFIVHRNKTKEDKVRNAETDDVILALAQTEDARLKIAKQRHGEWEGFFKFWFHGPSMQYTPNEDNRPLPFIFDASEATHER